MVNSEYTALTPAKPIFSAPVRQARPLPWFFAVKRGTDIVVSLLLLPVLLCLAAVLFVLNPIFNPGPVFYSQIRMGRKCRPFVVHKFRSMVPGSGTDRRAFDPVESHRIPVFGHCLRRSRLDELPQILNVLSGEMSLIGPRPDYIHHARYYVRHVPGYRARCRVRPGISGLAQTQIGYAQGADAVAAKVRTDIRYINNQCLGQEVRIFLHTIRTVFGLKGA